MSTASSDFKSPIDESNLLPHPASTHPQLPEYTPLPTSPSLAGTGSPAHSVLFGAPQVLESGTDAEPRCAEPLMIVKLLWTGLLALLLPPALLGALALASVGAMLFGIGKLLEGSGLAIAFAPRWAWHKRRPRGSRKLPALGGGAHAWIARTGRRGGTGGGADRFVIEAGT
ncbi:uncharacterized protein BXZ73DRAFT_79029 [Epithele typhae]|uniref:uncharacterized protein n=1 Tax=Epithele typhae TaxID=378194 RepID=UPI00200852CC|nr:uncharacterized protein BXZ73DRAFT_79029 [Epithele typhae]KAH9925365.1 hypothetical protein BXZ73DRAFT_79029 [Epithele typhae]